MGSCPAHIPHQHAVWQSLHTLIKTWSKKTHSLWLKSKRIDCFISIRRDCFLFGDGWQLSIPLHLPSGQGVTQAASKVLWAETLAVTVSSQPSVTLSWPRHGSQQARLDVSQLQADSWTNGLLARAFQSICTGWDPGTFESGAQLLAERTSGVELSAASLHPSVRAEEPPEGLKPKY